ncbi:MAG: RNA-splicing ligase RtcB [Nitrospiraceae bacterium]|nr:RNA-splicing ligase RtcB [Nitrospiraceae bacterium]
MAELRQIDETTWEIPRTGAMRVSGRIIANEKLLEPIRRDKAADQVSNVACLPGIVGHAWAMPDAHWGYGFPIGGVAATDPADGGVVSPGGVGYDINCGCRLMATRLRFDDIRPRVRDAIVGLYRDIPCGVGSEGAIPRLNEKNINAVLSKGAPWAVSDGYGTRADLDAIEDGGCIPGGDPDAVSNRAKERGRNQLGTLGSGNHFVELGVVEHIADDSLAKIFGLAQGFVTLMVHSGSRGLGYQVCDDSLQTMLRAVQHYGIQLPDRQLCCAPVDSPEGGHYLAAMAAAANYAFANRQIIIELARRSLEHTLRLSPRDLGAYLVYDVCHNIAKLEEHDVDGVRKRLCVHRKGATRAFPGSRAEVPRQYRASGQPVLVPGDMGTGSYVFAGTDEAMAKTFGSCCHGAGRVMSRTAARKARQGGDLARELAERGIVVMARSKKTLAEEAPAAYKDIDAVADVVTRAGIGRPVARIRPIGVIKG